MSPIVISQDPSFFFGRQGSKVPEIVEKHSRGPMPVAFTAGQGVLRGTAVYHDSRGRRGTIGHKGMSGPCGIIILEQNVVGGVPGVEIVEPPSLGESLGIQGPAIFHTDMGRGLGDQPGENKVQEGGISYPGMLYLPKHYGIASMHFQAVRVVDFHSDILYSDMGLNTLAVIFIDIGLAQGAVQMIVEGGIHGYSITFNTGYVSVKPDIIGMFVPMLLSYGIHP